MSSRHTTLRSLVEFAELNKYHNSTSPQIELSTEVLNSNYSTHDVHNGSILYQMERNNTLGNIEETLVNNNVCVQQNISLNNDNSTTSSSCVNIREWDVVFEFVFHGVLLNCVGILGLVGNLLSIFILSRPQMKGSTNCILIGLATYDSILIITR